LQTGNEMVIGPENPEWRENVGPYAPGAIVMRLMFCEKIDLAGGVRNYSQRGLDQSWRVQETWQQKPTVSTRSKRDSAQARQTVESCPPENSTSAVSDCN
jgi:hypothetical protein